MVWLNRTIDEAHAGSNDAKHVPMVVEEHNLTNKIFFITLDNASPNKTLIFFLKSLFSSYLGHALPRSSDGSDDLSIVFLHQHSVCHIIDLIVKSCLTIIKDLN
jgi:hypothetical protein